MTETRPDPDALLAKVERDEAKARRGRLKIFFGAAAGVGKTFAMLATTRERLTEGVDVVVGVVETHGRKETAQLLEGIERLPVKAVEYRGTTLQEFDLDAALQRQPSLLLVDELAHSNAPGSRHAKRWQDVAELLDAGINVFTTLNVQHLESLNDDVGQIAGIRIWETVPDTFFEEADEIELVDLPPEELLLRLKEGKVYLPEQAKLAARNFFRKGNLIALRELALRQTANQVDAQMRGYREDHAIRDIWQVGDRILVCIGPGSMGERLIRAGKRFATGLRAEWIVAYVETPELQRLPPEARDGVMRLLRFGEQLGAEAVVLNGASMSPAILEFARERNVTKIVMGKPTRRGWKRWLMGSVVDTLISEAHNINLYLLGSPAKRLDNGESAEPSLIAQPASPALQGPSEKPAKVRRQRYAWSALVVAGCTLIADLMFRSFDLTNLIMVYLVGIVIVAARYGRGPSIFAAMLAVGLFDLLFVYPYFSFEVADGQYLVTLGGMLAVAMVISHLMAHARYQARIAAHREQRATALFRMTRELAGARSESEIVRIVVRHVHAEFRSQAVVLFPDANGRITHPAEAPLTASLCGADLGVAQWVYDHREPAGQGTHTLAGAEAVYFPLAADDHALGVLAILPANLRRIFLPEQRQLLETFLTQSVHALERVHLAEQARTAAVEMEAERLRNSLLSSISHDLRTPLGTIVGSASTLCEQDESLSFSERQNLSRCIHEEAARMSSLITNILDMARLDAGEVKLDRQWHLVEELVGSAVTRLQRILLGRPVTTRLPADLPMLHVDGVMIEQVLINLLENAAKYTPEGSPIEITAEGSAFAVTVSVADRGPGIPSGQEEKLFEKFVRVEAERAQSGVGLGLAICRAIIEAHGGWIGAKNRGTGGAIFTFTIPNDRPPPSVEPEINS